MREDLKRHLKRRYGEIAKHGGSCCSPSARSCCCGSEGSEERQSIVWDAIYSKADLAIAPPESRMGLGCGNPVSLAEIREGEVVLDLGSGGGMDAFLASERTGKGGRVIGVDMSEEMVERARATAAKYGYVNVEFRVGDIESLPVEDSSVDVVISNCVINLALDKQKVFDEIYRVLRPWGRMIISDIVAEGRVPEEIRQDPDAWSACIAGAVEVGEYLDLIRCAGFADVRVLAESEPLQFSARFPDVRLKSLQLAARKPADTPPEIRSKEPSDPAAP